MTSISRRSLAAAMIGGPLNLAGQSAFVTTTGSTTRQSGFSESRLERLTSRLKQDINSGLFPGATVLLIRDSKVAFSWAYGRLSTEPASGAVSIGSTFRVSSMTKPLVAVGLLSLVEETKIDLEAPLSEYLPEFKEVRVGVERSQPVRPPTIYDMLRHTAGFTYGFGDSPVDKLYQQARMFTKGSLQEMVTTAASLPLAHQPGQAWEYSISYDLLGRVLEVVSGKPIDAFITERVTDPLKMKDTVSFLRQSQLQQFAQGDNESLAGLTQRPAVIQGGSQFFSSAPDYARFCQMLLNGGQLDGVRILAPHTVSSMCSDHLSEAIDRRTTIALAFGPLGPLPEYGIGFGLGCAVRVDAGKNPLPGSVGDYFWMGRRGPMFWVDPRERLIAVIMVAFTAPANGQVPHWRRMRTLVYQALVNRAEA
jgi:CubicO group peptidase (beta-lactamase class C family)